MGLFQWLDLKRTLRIKVIDVEDKLINNALCADTHFSVHPNLAKQKTISPFKALIMCSKLWHIDACNIPTFMKLTPGLDTEQISLFKSKLMCLNPKKTSSKKKRRFIKEKKKYQENLYTSLLLKICTKMFHKTIFTQINSQKVK